MVGGFQPQYYNSQIQSKNWHESSLTFKAWIHYTTFVQIFCAVWTSPKQSPSAPVCCFGAERVYIIQAQSPIFERQTITPSSWKTKYIWCFELIFEDIQHHPPKTTYKWHLLYVGIKISQGLQAWVLLWLPDLTRKTANRNTAIVNWNECFILEKGSKYHELHFPNNSNFITSWVKHRNC